MPRAGVVGHDQWLASSLHDRVTETVARCVTDVRMQQPATKYTLALHAKALEKSRRRDILDVAGCPHSVDRGLRQSPLDDGRQRFTHKTLAPPASHERVAKIHGTRLHTDLEQPDERSVLLSPESPRVCRPVGPGVVASIQKVCRVGGGAMRRPCH